MGITSMMLSLLLILAQVSCRSLVVRDTSELLGKSTADLNNTHSNEFSNKTNSTEHLSLGIQSDALSSSGEVHQGNRTQKSSVENTSTASLEGRMDAEDEASSEEHLAAKGIFEHWSWLEVFMLLLFWCCCISGPLTQIIKTLQEHGQKLDILLKALPPEKQIPQKQIEADTSAQSG